MYVVWHRISFTSSYVRFTRFDDIVRSSHLYGLWLPWVRRSIRFRFFFIFVFFSSSSSVFWWMSLTCRLFSRSTVAVVVVVLVLPLNLWPLQRLAKIHSISHQWGWAQKSYGWKPFRIFCFFFWCYYYWKRKCVLNLN